MYWQKINMSVKSATAIIDSQALLNNVSVIKSLAPQSKVLAVLKANAYGHGLERIAKILSCADDCADAFGVARLDEALALRAAGVKEAIVLLEGFFSAEDLATIAKHNFETVVHNKEQLIAIENANLSRPLKVWLKVDTGMHRLGVEPKEFETYYQALSQCKNVQKKLILMSHLASADIANSKETQQQYELFEQLTTHLEEDKSLANSAAIIAWEKCHYQWVRPGLMVYGVSPMSSPMPLAASTEALSSTASAEESPLVLKPVMTLKASLISVRNLPKGEPVGYGGTWISEQKTVIGVIAIGYGDGYPRHAKNGTPVLLNGRRVPIVGRVSMDMVTVDLGNKSLDKVGDLATLWGDKLSVAEIASCADTIPYELLCNITRRVKVTVV
jgi:alanine racemase|tara:strand:- start:1058 stop:2218 length:1161 start_codon:yes stop_codon:yes gene_type:complete